MSMFFCMQPNSQISKYLANLAIWLFGVDHRSVGHSSQKLWPEINFWKFPQLYLHCKLKIVLIMSFMGL